MHILMATYGGTQHNRELSLEYNGSGKSLIIAKVREDYKTQGVIK